MGTEKVETESATNGNSVVEETESIMSESSMIDDKTKAKLERLAHLEKENKELISQRDKAKEAKRKEAEDKLKQQGELQKLLDVKEKELEAVKLKADAFEQLRSVEIEEAKKVLKDRWLDDYESLSISALRKTVELLQVKPKIVGTDNGMMGELSTKDLTEAQKKEAYEKFPQWTKEKAEEAWYDVLKSTGKIK